MCNDNPNSQLKSNLRLQKPFSYFCQTVHHARFGTIILPVKYSAMLVQELEVFIHISKFFLFHHDWAQKYRKSQKVNSWEITFTYKMLENSISDIACQGATKMA